MINCYLEEGDFSNAFKCLKKVVKVIFDVNSKPSSNYFRELIHLAAVIDKQISGKAMVDSFDQIRGIDFLNYLYQSTGEMLWAEKNFNEAIKSTGRAADREVIFAQSQLGWVYSNGNGVERVASSKVRRVGNRCKSRCSRILKKKNPKCIQLLTSI